MRIIIPSIAIAALAAMAIGGGTISVAHADGEMGYIGSRTPAKGACPGIETRVIPAPPNGGPVKGIMYFADMSGVSTIQGMVAADGTITGTVTSVSGKGPTGTTSGRRDKTGTHVELKGPGCSNFSFDMKRWVPGTAATGGD